MTLSHPNFYKMPFFKPLNEFFDCNYVKWALILLKSNFFIAKKGWFSWRLGTKIYDFLFLAYAYKLTLDFGCLLWVKPGNETLINYRYNGPFLHQNWSRFFFRLLRQNAVDIQNWRLCGWIYPSSFICLSRICFNWWLHKWYKGQVPARLYGNARLGVEGLNTWGQCVFCMMPFPRKVVSC